MSSLACTRCGAEIIPGTRFCRQCGQPAPDAANISEASTRILGAQEHPPAAPTDRFTPMPTGPAYISPADAGATQFTPSQSLAAPPKKRRGKLWLAILFIILLFGGLATVAAIIVVKKGQDIARKIVIKQTSEVPKPPQQPTTPGSPQTTTTGTTTIDSALVYPGAETLVDVDNGAEGHVVQLRTSDPLNKVTDWYVKNLKPSQVVHMPMTDSGSILRTTKGTIVITHSDDGTQILIKQGGDQD